MIPSSHRLRTKEVIEVLKKGRGLPAGTYLSAKVLAVSKGATIRSAAVVSKKVAKTAVMRNRIRRALYDAIRSASGAKHLTNYDKTAYIVFFVRSIPQGSLRTAFAADITKLLGAL
jgi:ribonuclease P protein component